MLESTTAPVFVCILCANRYGIQDIKDLHYFASTGVCLSCYQAGKKSASWCFGKLTKIRSSRSSYGYDAKARACSVECPDKKICYQFVTGVLE